MRKFSAHIGMVIVFLLVTCCKKQEELIPGKYYGAFIYELPIVIEKYVYIDIQEVKPNGVVFSGTYISKNEDKIFGHVQHISGFGSSSSVYIDSDWSTENGHSMIKGTFSYTQYYLNGSSYPASGRFEIHRVQ